MEWSSRRYLVFYSRLAGWSGILVWWFCTTNEPPSRFTLQSNPLWFYLVLPILIPYLQWGWYRLVTKASLSQHLFSIPSHHLSTITIRQTTSKYEPNIHARGTILHPMIVIHGQVEWLTPEQRRAIFWHEWSHLKHWDLSCNILMFLCVVDLTHHLLLAVFALRAYSRMSEFRADQYSTKYVSANDLIAALIRIVRSRTTDWLEYIPILNLVLTHPSTASRIDAIAKLQHHAHAI